MKSYTLEIHDNGILVFGSIPIGDMSIIDSLAESHGFPILDPGAAQAFGATLCITNESGAGALRAEITETNKNKSREDAWILGCDTGLSSKTIFSVMTGKSDVGHGDHPWDCDDFGRCYRLLKLFPEWKSRLGEVSARYPAWTGLVSAWDELTELFEAEKWDDLYEMMQIAYGRKKCE